MEVWQISGRINIVIVIEGVVLLAVDWSKTTTIEGASFYMTVNRSH